MVSGISQEHEPLHGPQGNRSHGYHQRRLTTASRSQIESWSLAVFQAQISPWLLVANQASTSVHSSKHSAFQIYFFPQHTSLSAYLSHFPSMYSLTILLPKCQAPEALSGLMGETLSVPGLETWGGAELVSS